jgi:hypothetical protein
MMNILGMPFPLRAPLSRSQGPQPCTRVARHINMSDVPKSGVEVPVCSVAKNWYIWPMRVYLASHGMRGLARGERAATASLTSSPVCLGINM